ncbi:HEAT repeat domain-containing protein [Cryobacterium sp. TMT2-15-1]|uniref:HEAT repeat domain-containing protein n=1 Tax=Cryobacterium sp. TMT2-15-1 TaxID=1259246 RepID=UPI00106DA794|nr:HEAT repeat domain-containing protein [Cryobacterium sp. TMT2-15-1]TFC54101.1 HEAT repeat domain-containing protein [Cryobacterium sp. TMT2-15-1]
MREAVRIVEKALNDHDDYNPVDHAWLTMHLARNLAQVGELKRALELALDVAPIGQIAASDPTARLLSGIASDMVFSLSGWQAEDIASTIRARDTAASWWRSQTMTSGLAKHLETAFKSWANDQSVTWGGSDETWTKLRSATLISGHAADTPNWRYESSLLAQHILMLELESGQVTSALNLLRIGGLDTELKLVVNRILDRGPTAALEDLISRLDLTASTRDSMKCDLEILGLSAALLTSDVAGKTVVWIMSELEDPLERARSLGLRFLYAERLVTALARVYLACTPEIQAAVREYVGSLPIIEDQSLAHNYALLLRNIDDLDWDDDQIEVLRSRPEGDNCELRDELETLLASRDTAFRSELVARIKDGNVRALSSFGDVRDLSGDAAAGMITHTAAAVRTEIESARVGAYAYGAPSALERLVLLNIWHPTRAQWDPCIEQLSEKDSSPSQLAPGLQLLVTHAQRIPVDLKEGLREPLQRLSTTAPDERSPGSLFGSADVRGDASLLVASLFSDEMPAGYLLDLLRGTSEQVVGAVQIVANRQNESALPLLAVLATNADVEIRAAAVQALADWVSLGIGGTESRELLKALLDEPGVRLAARVTRSVGRQQRSRGTEYLMDLLEEHQSAVVRKHVSVIRRHWAAEEGH